MAVTTGKFPKALKPGKPKRARKPKSKKPKVPGLPKKTLPKTKIEEVLKGMM